MISMATVHVRYGRTQALQGISLHLDEGITAVVGPNGAGKTTLLRLLATRGPSESLVSIRDTHGNEQTYAVASASCHRTQTPMPPG